jgi:hypothetical protein
LLAERVGLLVSLVAVQLRFAGTGGRAEWDLGVLAAGGGLPRAAAASWLGVLRSGTVV